MTEDTKTISSTVFFDFYGGNGRHYVISLAPPFTDKKLAVLFGTVFETMIKAGVPISKVDMAPNTHVTYAEKNEILEESVHLEEHDVGECVHGPEDPSEAPEDPDLKIMDWVMDQVRKEIVTE